MIGQEAFASLLLSPPELSCHRRSQTVSGMCAVFRLHAAFEPMTGFFSECSRFSCWLLLSSVYVVVTEVEGFAVRSYWVKSSHNFNMSLCQIDVLTFIVE